MTTKRAAVATLLTSLNLPAEAEPTDLNRLSVETIVWLAGKVEALKSAAQPETEAAAVQG
jgi:hypothetical protein